MISISLNKIHLILGAKTIFTDLDWEIQHDQKIGLIGPNGAGKSSLFKLITGEYTAEKGGAVTRARGVSVGYLAQEPQLDPQTTGFEAALQGNPRVGEVARQLNDIEKSLSDPQVYGNENRLAQALEKQQVLLTEYQSYGGDQYPSKVREVLRGLGLKQGEEDKPIANLERRAKEVDRAGAPAVEHAGRAPAGRAG